MQLEKFKGYLKDSWISLLQYELLTLDIIKLRDKYAETICYPAQKDIFAPFNEFEVEDLKVVIIGQDPYYDGSSVGTAFNNLITKKPSPSLRNIIKECEDDEGFTRGETTYLENWISQGVLLMNTAFTVEADKPGSHIELWADFTQGVIKRLQSKDNIVWVLWGNYAKAYKCFITNPTHHIIEGYHPSPYSAPKFFGGKYFSRINSLLATPVKW
jgi:uracil-DNA glycosylase